MFFCHVYMLRWFVNLVITHDNTVFCFSSQDPSQWITLQSHQESNDLNRHSEDAPPPLPQRRNQLLNVQSPTSPTLIVTHASPFSSPRSSSRSSPHSSPWNSPRTSPRNSPRSSPLASPNVSPHSSPQASPCNSPQNSPAQIRKGRPPPPPIDNENDSPPAIPERSYKSRGSVEKKDKNRDVNRERGDNRRDTIGYADIDTSNVPSDSHNQISHQNRTNYAQLAYPAPDNDLGASGVERSTANGNMFAEICTNDEAACYDFPLPILSDKGDNTPFKQNGLSNSAGSLEPVADPFADDPFAQCGESKDKEFENDFLKGPLVVALPPPRSQSFDTWEARGTNDKGKRPSSSRTFIKARSTDDVLDDPTYSNAKTAANKWGKNRNSAAVFNPPNTFRPSLVSRNSWSGAEAKSFSNPTYTAENFDPSKLEANEDARHRRLPRLPDDNSNNDAMQFYEEDFTILQAQGYSREEITRALIVAENNFAMARKILREFSQGARKL